MTTASKYLLALSILAAALATGCKTASTYSFSVSVKNTSDEPVTVWLTKEGGPDETDWLAPEMLANTRAAQLDAINGVVVPPGKTGEMGPIKGKFEPQSLAILRVYAGQLTLDQLLATRADGKLRVDVRLNEGMNHLTVTPSPTLHVESAEAVR